MKKGIYTLTALLLLIAFACNKHPYSSTNKVYKKQVKTYLEKIGSIPPITLVSDTIPPSPYWVGTTNFGIRKPSYVIIHHTAQHSTEQTLTEFTLPRTAVSEHYVIGSDGKVYQMLNDYFRGQHAGVSRWGNQLDMTSASIGIELDNNGFEYFEEAQINSLLVELGKLKRDFSTPTASLICDVEVY